MRNEDLTPMDLIPEYLCLMPAGTDARIQAKSSIHAKVRVNVIAYQVALTGVAMICHPATGEPFKLMYFDERLFEVERYDLDLAKKLITVHVGNPVEETDDQRTALNNWHSCHS
jgi:hypothetical protein